jgi:hypothetical protein
MSTKRFALALALAALLAGSAFANKKDDKYAQAQQAVSAKDFDKARQLFCDIANDDPSYKDAKMNCSIYTDMARREDQKNEDRWKNGVNNFNAGKFDDALYEFRNIHYGKHYEEAQNYISNKIPQAMANLKNQNEENAAQQKYDQAVAAYNKNDFSGAQGLFAQITGKHQSDAQNYLNKIKQYQQAMSEGDRLAGAKNYRAALNSYNDAATIKSDGPGNPKDKANQMQLAMNTPATTTTTTTVAQKTTPPPNPTTPTPEPRKVITTAVKETPQPKIDINKMLQEADAAKAKGNIAAARGKYLAVLAVDPANATARAALDSLEQSTPATASAPKAGSEADVMLVKAIREYYQGQYDDAEVHIKDYLNVNGSKAALANFYLGASKITRYYLGGEQPHDKKLLADAQDQFRLAKKAGGFTPPGQEVISPKILKAYEQTN